MQQARDRMRSRYSSIYSRDFAKWQRLTQHSRLCPLAPLPSAASLEVAKTQQLVRALGREP